nr:C-X-C motif chemokine 2 isoform X1 [Saimiri boliviensis boliviensis]
MHKKDSPTSGSHRARAAGTSPPALPLLAPPPDPPAEPHGPRRALRRPPQPPAPAGGAAAPAPGGRRPARGSRRVSSSLGAPLANELRCQCLQTLQGIHLKNIQSVEVKRPGPHCDRTEVIATLRNGQKACLNPASPMAKKIIEKMLNSDKPN